MSAIESAARAAYEAMMDRTAAAWQYNPMWVTLHAWENQPPATRADWIAAVEAARPLLVAEERERCAQETEHLAMMASGDISEQDLQELSSYRELWGEVRALRRAAAAIRGGKP